MVLYKSSAYKIQKGDKFIFDANVWIKLMPSFENLTNKHYSDKYSNLLQNILDNNCKIGILNIEISEIFNVFMREQAKFFLKGRHKATYKRDYRSSKQFEVDKNIILNEIKNIIFNFGDKLNDTFENIDTEKILDTERNNYDFNDNYMYQFCEKNNYIFVTHDRDYSQFKDLNIKVISEI